MSIKWMLYRLVMRIAHRYNWHYAPPCYPDGDTMLWCRWCGMRDVVHRSSNSYPTIEPQAQAAERLEE